MATYNITTHCLSGDVIQLYVSGDTAIFVEFPDVNELAISEANLEQNLIGTFADISNVNVVYSYDVDANILSVSVTYDNITGINRPLIITGNGGSTGGCAEILTGEAVTDACTTCQTVELKSCLTEYSFTTGLTGTTDYIVVITDRDGKEWVQSVTSDASGDLSITTTEFPEGFFTPENSPLQLEVKVSAYGDPLTLTQDATTYPCYNLYFVNREDTTPIILWNLFIRDDGAFLTNETGNNLLST